MAEKPQKMCEKIKKLGTRQAKELSVVFCFLGGGVNSKRTFFLSNNRTGTSNTAFES